MRMKLGLLAILTVGALSQALAAEPPTEPASTSTPAATTPAASTAATSTEQAPADKAATTATAATTQTTMQGAKVKLVAGDEAAAARLKRLQAAGYKPEMRGQQVVFCRRQAELGSRFERKVCNTAEVLDEQLNNAQDMTERTQRNGLSMGNPHGG